MKATRIEQARFEPTVFGAMRRYPAMVLVIALLTAAGAVGYTLVEPEVYRAHATVTVPQTSMSEGESSDQYLDSQVLLLQSQEVADRAAQIANAKLKGNVLSARDFSHEGKLLEIKAPVDNDVSSIVTVSFDGPSARIAQVGANAVLQAFDDVRADSIAAQGDAIVAGIEKAIDDARTKGQVKELLNQRSQELVKQQVDLARHPTIAWADEPEVPMNANSKRAGAIGLAIGIVLGAGLAYARASRRRYLEDRLEPGAIYDAPLIGEIPARRADRMHSLTGASKKAANRPTGQIAIVFGLVALFAIGFVVVYFAVPGEASVDLGFLQANSRNLVLGTCLGLALLFFLGIGAVQWTRKHRAAVADPLPMAGEPKSPVAEAFRFTAGSIERIHAARGNPLAVALVSTDASIERSSVVANVALAVAESRTSVLAVDADSTYSGLTALLLPGSPPAAGFEQVLSGQHPLSECIQPSPLNDGITVLPSGPTPTERTTGAAYSRGLENMIANAKASFDLVLIDSPPLLRVADATALVDNSDVAIVVLGSDETVRDHITMMERLVLVKSEVVGYIYRRARRVPWFARHVRHPSSTRVARGTGMPIVPSYEDQAGASYEDTTTYEDQAGASYEDTTTYEDQAGASYEDHTGTHNGSYQDHTGTSYEDPAAASYEDHTGTHNGSYQDHTGTHNGSHQDQPGTSYEDQAGASYEDTTTRNEDHTGATSNEDTTTSDEDQAGASSEDTATSYQDQSATGNGRDAEPDQPSARGDGTWQLPPWFSDAAFERENSRSLLRRSRG
jgi:Mrp family chromosome partitioning ATPase